MSERDQSSTSAGRLFARASELGPGLARDQFLAANCAGNRTLRLEVESLLQAHDRAGGFLRTASVPGEPAAGRKIAGPPSGTAALNAAAQAEIFLRLAGRADAAGVEEFLAGVADGLREEARERIQAGLRARQMSKAPGPERRSAETAPCLPGFQIERKLGEGGLGAVYVAYDEKLQRRVALKVIRSGADDSVRRRILEEARNTAALADPAVVTIFSVLDEASPPAIVMELVEGFPLDQFAAQLDFQQKARLLREVARGLAVAHARGLVHRDVKPANVVVGPDMRPRLLDFGLALSLEEAGRSGRGFEGTPLYASPEQALGRPLTAASDVFSLGSLMFKVITGRAPFNGDSISGALEAIATTAPPFLREVALGVPDDLQAICLACLAWSPADRPTAADVELELGRFLIGEPVRLRPKLYDDLLRRSISEHSHQARNWESQSIISTEERDSLEVVHRRLLADEDHWIIDARRITLLQTVLSAGTWLAVVATVLSVWLLREDLGPLWRWLFPLGFTVTLLLTGIAARRKREHLAAATFLAGAVLAMAPCALSLLAAVGALAVAPAGVTQLFPGSFTNQQVLAASLAALAVSGFGLRRLRMTGFAWTTAALATGSYVGLLLLFDWLAQKPEIKAAWCLPLAAMEPVALLLERRGLVRWTLPFHLVALLATVAGLDVIALNGSTLDLLGVNDSRWAYFDADRRKTLSVVMNGLLFLGLMLATEKSASLDLRRGSRLLEILAILHTLTPLFANALDHRTDPQVRVDAAIYIGAALAFTVLAPFRSRWRLLVGGLAGCGLGSYLLVDLGLVARTPFIVGLGFAGLLVALGAFAYARRRPRSGGLAEPGRAGHKTSQPQLPPKERDDGLAAVRPEI